MSTELIGLIGVIAVLILMFARMWVGMAMMLVGIVGCAILSNWDAAGIIAGVVPYSEVANYKLSAVPLFILMGCVLSVTGLGADLYNFARCMLNRIKGGLAMATIAACGLFSAVCGDSVATAVTMGKVAYPEMKKYGYDDKLSGASIVAGGTLGIMIPPSISFIIYYPFNFSNTISIIFSIYCEPFLFITQIK